MTIQQVRVHELPKFRVGDDQGHYHDCTLHAFKLRKVPGKGTFLELWFRPLLWMPDPPLYGPYLYGRLNERVIVDDRLECLNEEAERKLALMLARAEDMRYQETPFLNIGGDEDTPKVYRRE